MNNSKDEDRALAVATLSVALVDAAIFARARSIEIEPTDCEDEDCEDEHPFYFASLGALASAEMLDGFSGVASVLTARVAQGLNILTSKGATRVWTRPMVFSQVERMWTFEVEDDEDLSARVAGAMICCVANSRSAKDVEESAWRALVETLPSEDEQADVLEVLLDAAGLLEVLVTE